MIFDHEKLSVYQASLEFIRFTRGITEGLKGDYRATRDQLFRSAQSIPLNIAEGNGKRSSRDRMRFWEIARGSAMESAATLDVLVCYGVCSEQDVMPGKTLLFRIVSMLSKMTEPREDRGHCVREQGGEYGIPDGESAREDIEPERE